MDHDPTLVKGDQVHAAWMEATDACLSGSQMKSEAKTKEVRGTVTHIRGNHPTEPTSIRIWVKPDDGSDEVIIRPEWIKAFEAHPRTQPQTGQGTDPGASDDTSQGSGSNT